MSRGVVRLVGVVVVPLVLLLLAACSESTRTWTMPAESMEPTIPQGAHIATTLPDGYVPARGDIIVFRDPGGWLAAGSDDGHLVKRVIGVAGDTVECCDEDGRLQVNGESLDEPFLAPRAENVPCDGPMIPTCAWTAGPVPDGRLFVMGDNRAHSADSSFRLCTESETDCTKDPYVDVSLVEGVVTNVAG